MLNFAYKIAGPSDYVTREFKVAINQTLVFGQVVTLVEGLVTAHEDDDTTILGVTLAAKTTGGTVTAADVVMVLIPADCVFTVGISQDSDKTDCVDADLGNLVGFLDSGLEISLDDVTNHSARIVDWDNDKKIAYVILQRQLIS